MPLVDKQLNKMDFEAYKEKVKRMACEWANRSLSGSQLSYIDCLHSLGHLTRAESKGHAEYILMGIINQAIQLNKPDSWIEQEMHIELLAEATNREELLRLRLRYSNPVDDAALDAYNERMDRFISIPKRLPRLRPLMG